jgi:hypothetical protein
MYLLYYSKELYMKLSYGLVVQSLCIIEEYLEDSIE